jgi:Flp pilus assembly protein TadG
MSDTSLPIRLGRDLLERALRPLAGRLAALSSSVAGVAAVEFALVLPVMVTMLLGMSEVTLAVNVDRKLTLLSRSLADLSSRRQALSEADMLEIFQAASVVMQPYDASKLQMVVSQMRVETTDGTTFRGNVDWSCPRGTGAVPKPNTQTYDVPSGFQNAKASTPSSAAVPSFYILIETKLPYTPLFGKAITGTINLEESTPWPIRNNTRVTAPAPCPANT